MPISLLRSPTLPEFEEGKNAFLCSDSEAVEYGVTVFEWAIGITFRSRPAGGQTSSYSFNVLRSPGLTREKTCSRSASAVSFPNRSATTARWVCRKRR